MPYNLHSFVEDNGTASLKRRNKILTCLDEADKCSENAYLCQGLAQDLRSVPDIKWMNQALQRIIRFYRSTNNITNHAITIVKSLHSWSKLKTVNQVEISDCNCACMCVWVFVRAKSWLIMKIAHHKILGRTSLIKRQLWWTQGSVHLVFTQT